MFNRIRSLLLIMFLSIAPLNLMAEVDNSDSLVFQKGDPNIAAKYLNEISGAYRRYFISGTVDNEKYEAEDIIEIVPIDELNIYFRTRLNFFNGHSCAHYGIAEFRKNNKFVYQSALDSETMEQCTLIIDKDSKSIKIDVYDSPDDKIGSNCSNYCGARGSLNGTELPVKSRRKITYIDKIKSSTEYKEAIEEYKKLRSAS